LAGRTGLESGTGVSACVFTEIHGTSSQVDAPSEASKSATNRTVGPAGPNAIDAVEGALAAGIAALAASMANVGPADLVGLADRMATLARELEARRLARASNVLDLERRRRDRAG
jgi:hypothetical protein